MTTEEQRQDAQLDAIGNKTTALGYRVMSVQPEVALRRLLTHFDSTDPALAEYIRKGPESAFVLVPRSQADAIDRVRELCASQQVEDVNGEKTEVDTALWPSDVLAVLGETTTGVIHAMFDKTRRFPCCGRKPSDVGAADRMAVVDSTPITCPGPSDAVLGETEETK